MAETWRQRSAKIIHERFTSIKQAQPQLDDEMILRMVSRNYYPFGPRSNFPYQAWLTAIKDYRKALKIPTKRELETELPLFL